MVRRKRTGEFRKQMSRILQPSLELIQGDDLPVAVLFLCLGGFVPGGELFLREFPGLDPGEAAFVLPAVRLKNLIAPAALRPLLDRGSAAAELAGRAGTATILRRKVPPTTPASPDRDLPSDTFPEREVYQIADRVGIQDLSAIAISEYGEADGSRLKTEEIIIPGAVK